MKALVLEIKNGKAAVLREDGIVVTVSQPCEVGETIELSERTVVRTGRRRGRFFRAAVAAILALCIAGGGFGYMSASASSYVSIDAGEASVEVAVNHFGRVIDVKALGEGSEDFAKTLKSELKNRSFKDAAPMIVDRIGEEGFMEECPDEPILAGIVAGSERQREQINEGLRGAFSGRSDQAPTDEFVVPALVMLEMDKQDRKDALENHQSPGRYMMDRQRPEEGPGAGADAPPEEGPGAGADAPPEGGPGTGTGAPPAGGPGPGGPGKQ